MLAYANEPITVQRIAFTQSVSGGICRLQLWTTRRQMVVFLADYITAACSHILQLETNINNFRSVTAVMLQSYIMSCTSWNLLFFYIGLIMLYVCQLQAQMSLLVSNFCMLLKKKRKCIFFLEISRRNLAFTTSLKHFPGLRRWRARSEWQCAVAHQVVPCSLMASLNDMRQAAGDFSASRTGEVSTQEVLRHRGTVRMHSPSSCSRCRLGSVTTNQTSPCPTSLVWITKEINREAAEDTEENSF